MRSNPTEAQIKKALDIIRDEDETRRVLSWSCLRVSLLAPDGVVLSSARFGKSLPFQDLVSRWRSSGRVHIDGIENGLVPLDCHVQKSVKVRIDGAYQSELETCSISLMAIKLYVCAAPVWLTVADVVLLMCGEGYETFSEACLELINERTSYTWEKIAVVEDSGKG